MRHNFDFESKNQINENVRRMRDIQKKCKQKEAESQVPVKVLWKSDKYSTVQSKIKRDIEVPQTPRPSSAHFLRAHSRAGPPVKLESRPCTPDIAAKRSVPPASSVDDVKLIRNSFDFIKINGINAKRTNVERPPSRTEQEDTQMRREEHFKSHPFGEVPSYLRKRKTEWRREEETKISNTPDPAMPPGHKQLPDSERMETLKLLKEKQGKIIEDIQRVPIGADTVRVRQLRKSLENQLTEVEEATKIFSRPKVFVKVDN